MEQNENQQPKKQKMNLPNKLTVMRVILVPVILLLMLLPYRDWLNVLALIVFCAASFTDYLDGHLARKYHLVTDFGKFLDPLADKFMVLAAIFGIIWRYHNSHELMFIIFMIMMIVTVFRELAVASLRLITVQNAGVVVAANMLGKIKTVSQMICLILAMVEPMVNRWIGFKPDSFFHDCYLLTYVTAAVAIVFTILSGVKYVCSLWKYMSPEK